MRRFVTRRLLIAFGIIAVLAGTGAVVWARQGGAAVQYRTAAATLGTVTQSIAMSGNLASAAETDLTFGSSGKVAAVNVAVGQTVGSGQALASLDTTSLQDALTTAQDNLSSAQARLSLDQAGATPSTLAQAESQVSSAQVAVQNDETSLRDTEAVNQTSVNQAQTQTNNDCAGSGASSAQCRQDQSNLQATTARAQQSNDQAVGQLNAAKVQLQSAQSALGVLQQGTTSQQIQMDQSQVQIDQVNVSAAQTALNQATITTPVPGVVAAVNVTVAQQVSSGSGSAGGAAASSSSSSSSSSAAIVLLTPGLFDVTGSVSDAQVNEVALGQEADVVPAGMQQAVTGKVTQVAQEATITSGVATFPVTVLLDGTNNSLRVGMSASVNIVVNRVVQVLTVPTSAVHTTTAGSTVNVLVGGQSQVRQVTVGSSDATRTQIVSGLNAGDQVVIATVTSSVPSSGAGTGARAFGGGFGGGGLGGGRGGGGGGVTGG